VTVPVHLKFAGSAVGTSGTSVDVARTGAAARELTAFVREVVLPGGPGAIPRLDAAHCRFRVEHRPSPIHRWGLFALEDIPPRRRVLEYTGQRITPEEAWRRRLRHHIYLIWVSRTRVIDGAIGGSGAEFCNHSCAPNLFARVTRGRIFFVSLRHIGAGEELTIDYRISSEAPVMRCECGAVGCRGVINLPADAIER
jgi:hypothetical protein